MMIGGRGRYGASLPFAALQACHSMVLLDVYCGAYTSM